MIKNLPEKSKKELDIAFKKCKNLKESTRIQVIRLLSQGKSHTETSQITNISEGGIKKLVGIYNKDGLVGLRLKPKPVNRYILTSDQKNNIKHLLHKFETPSKAGIKVSTDNDFWSIPTLKLLVHKEYKLAYKNKDSYRKLLKFCGFTYQKVEFEDERKSNEQGAEFKKRFEGKLKKGGRFSMWW